MEVVKINNHPVASNTYIVFNENSNKAVIIDPSFNIASAVNAILSDGLEITAILLTHGHFDHIAGVDSIRKSLNIPLYIHKNDADMLFSSEKNHGSFWGFDVATDPAENVIHDNDIINEGQMCFKVLHTPGHTKGSVCFICDDCIFTGDTLFYMSIGRTDLPGGDFDEIRESLRKLASLDFDYKVYPGHEQSTSLFYEKDNNPFM